MTNTGFNFSPVLIILGILCLVAFIVIVVLTKFSTNKGSILTPTVGWDFFGIRSKLSIFFAFIKRQVMGKAAGYGYAKANDLSRSFNQAKTKLIQEGGTPHAIYSNPWYLLLGREGSGKRTLAGALSSEVEIIGNAESDTLNTGNRLGWWFFNHGTLLVPDGKMLEQESSFFSRHSGWRLFVNLLTRHRNKRPLDGIIIAIPADDLMPGDKEKENLIAFVTATKKRLQYLQRQLGFSLPVYVIVTKSDHIDGFNSFKQGLPQGIDRQAFGWSNPYRLDQNFETRWVDTIFDALDVQVRLTQQTIFADAGAQLDRDGLFIFPLALQEIKESASFFLEQIFKETAFEEGLMLRGVYLTGEKDLNASGALAKSIFSTIDHTDQKPLSFIHDLFYEKIFPEVGVARPLPKTITYRTDAQKALRTVAIVAGVVCTWTLWSHYQNLKNAQQTTKINLIEANQSFEKVADLDRTQSVSRYVQNAQTQVLINSFAKSSLKPLKSWSILSSWASDIDKKVLQAYGLAYEKIVLASLLNELQYRVNTLITSPPLTSAADKKVHGFVVDPSTLASYQDWQKYIEQLTVLDNLTRKFNNLSTGRSVSDLGELILALYNIKLGNIFYENAPFYEAVLGQSTLYFDYSPYIKSSTTQLDILYHQFINELFDFPKSYADIEKLVASLNAIMRSSQEVHVELSHIRELQALTNSTVQNLANPAFNWIDKQTFEPNALFGQMVNQIYNSSFLEDASVEGLTSFANKQFLNFKEVLTKMSTIATDFLVGKAEDQSLAPSTGLLQLQSSLNMFFGETFVRTVKKTHEDKLPPLKGADLYWDVTSLQEASGIADAYSAFLGKRLLTYPKALQFSLRQVAGEGAANLLRHYIEQAMTYQVIKPNLTSYAPEEELIPQVQNFRMVHGQVLDLLSNLVTMGAQDLYLKIRDIEIQQNYQILLKLDRILEQEEAYTVRDTALHDWNGITNIVPAKIFGLADTVELKSYLGLQRERIGYLAKEFAEPAVSFLQQVNADQSKGYLPLIKKWSNILAQLADYTNHAKFVSLGVLENFIQVELPKTTLPTCKALKNFESSVSVNTDYFLHQQSAIAQQVLNQCVIAANALAGKTYNVIASYFNDYLAGKFPFVDVAGYTTEEAHPAAVQGFFDLLKKNGVEALATLKLLDSPSPTQKEAVAFIESAVAFQTFMEPVLKPGADGQRQVIAVRPSFRVDRNKESNGNQVVDWVLQTADQRIDWRTPNPMFSWTYGQSIDLTFRWALNSPERPYGIASKDDMVVNGDSVTFKSKGNWGLFWLLKKYQLSLVDVGTTKDNMPYTLRFNVPLATGLTPQSARLFVRLELLKNTKEGPMPLTLPPIPFQAPTLTKLYNLSFGE